MSGSCTSPLNNIRNKKIITKKSFPSNLKLADVTAVFKKEVASFTSGFLTNELRVASYDLHTSYELLLIAQVTS